MPVELFQEPVRRRYYASYMSCSYLFFLVTVWILIALPFFLSFDANFWKKTGTYLEQPYLAYSYKTLISASGPDTAVTYSSVPAVSKLQESTFRACTVKTRSDDANLDGVMDEFLVTVTIPTLAGEAITKVDAVFFFHTQLRDRAKIVMESAVHLSYDSGLPGAEFFVVGDAKFHQVTALPIRGGYTTLHSETDVFDPVYVASTSEVVIPAVLEELGSRNSTIAFEPQFSHWQPSIAAADGSEGFTIRAKIKIPKSEVLYIPTASEVLRDAWTKYLSMFIVVGFFLEKLCSFVYFHQIVESKMLVESVGSQVGVPHFKKF